MLVAARWRFFDRDVGNHALLAARARPVFTFRHVQPLRFVRLPTWLLVWQHRCLSCDSGVCQPFLFRLASNVCGPRASLVIFRTR